MSKRHLPPPWSTMERISSRPTVFAVLSFAVIILLPLSVHSHVSLTFPPSRRYSLDFLDSVRTTGPCGMPKGRIGTTLASGIPVNVSWHLAYPHRGGYRLELLDEDENFIMDLIKRDDPDSKDFVEGDPTALWQTVTIPHDLTCEFCTIRLVRQATEWSKSYMFWSCADVAIVPPDEYVETCSGHGGLILDGAGNACKCHRGFWGSKCQYENECETNEDCGNGKGMCVDIGGTSLPRKQCFCSHGTHGMKCEKTNSAALPSHSGALNLKGHTEKKLSASMTLYYKVIPSEEEMEFVIVMNGSSYGAVGWRPTSINKTCKALPSLNNLESRIQEYRPRIYPNSNNRHRYYHRITRIRKTHLKNTSDSDKVRRTRQSEDKHKPNPTLLRPISEVEKKWGRRQGNLPTVATSTFSSTRQRYDGQKSKPEPEPELQLPEPEVEPTAGRPIDKQNYVIRHYNTGIASQATNFNLPQGKWQKPTKAEEGVKSGSPEPEPTPETEPEPEGEPEAESEPKPGASRAEPEPESESEPSKAEPEPNAKAESQAEPEPESGTSKSEPEPTPEVNTHGGSGAAKKPPYLKYPHSEKAQPEPEPENNLSFVEPEPESEPNVSGSSTRERQDSYIPKGDFHAMDCTDIIIGSARGQYSRILDYYTRDRSTPQLDEFWLPASSSSAGLTSAGGWETTSGQTILIFRRKIKASSKDWTDYDLKGDLLLIWARGQEAGAYRHSPKSGLEAESPSIPNFYQNDELKYHGHGKMQRGTSQLSL